MLKYYRISGCVVWVEVTPDQVGHLLCILELAKTSKGIMQVSEGALQALHTPHCSALARYPLTIRRTANAADPQGYKWLIALKNG